MGEILTPLFGSYKNKKKKVYSPFGLIKILKYVYDIYLSNLSINWKFYWTFSNMYVFVYKLKERIFSYFSLQMGKYENFLLLDKIKKIRRIVYYNLTFL